MKLVLVLASVLCSIFPTAFAVYKLKYIGGADVGNRGTDAAEHAAYDSVTHTVFVGGADAIVVKAFDVADPTSPVLRRTLDVTSHTGSCPSSITAQSLQSVAVVRVSGYAHPVLATAIMNQDRLENGAVLFFRADTFEFLTCEASGVGPEGIKSDGTSLIVIANEGYDERQKYYTGSVSDSGMAETDYAYDSVRNNDPKGSITVCTASAPSGTLSISCETKDLRPSLVEGDNYCEDPCVTSSCSQGRIAHYQQMGIRLFGPGLLNDGDVLSRVMEPEGVAITEDSAYVMTVFQGNNAYGIYSVASGTWVKIGSLGTQEMTMDANDDDDQLLITNSFGSSNTRVYGMPMPDQVTSFTYNGAYYFVTSNEGNSKGCDTSVIGNVSWSLEDCEEGDNAADDRFFEGEEVQLRRVNCDCTDCCERATSLGRLKTSPYMPGNYIADNCPVSTCGVAQTCASSEYWRTSPYEDYVWKTTPNSTDARGAPGGIYAFGTRSATVWRWDGGSSDLVKVWDSGSKFEMLTGGGDIPITSQDLCATCLASPSESNCENCPFNSDTAPPDFDDRSNSKGPEPECVTTGVLADGTRLAFVGLERTGGIVTYDMSDPTAPVFQDFLNVRNWKVGEAGFTDESYLLFDGPEELIFVDAASSPIGNPMLIAAHPHHGHISLYLIESGDARTDDGSCYDTATCGYISTELGGTGSLLITDVCTISASGSNAYIAAGCTSGDASSSDNDDDSATVIAITIPIIVVALLVGVIGMYCMYKRGSKEGYQQALVEKQDKRTIANGLKGGNDVHPMDISGGTV